ncbi:MAG: DUF58 domain-containing protein [Oligoflexus sp.]
MTLATLRELQPQLGGEPRFPFTKASPRYMGSARLNLQRPSRMPASSRKYLHGDPVHLIDWRAYARNDQLIIREQRDEASTKVIICIDLNDTMNWPEADLQQGPSKQEIALRVALHLAFSHFKKGDIVKLVVWSGPNKEPTQILRLSSATDVLKIFDNLRSQKFHLEPTSNLLSPYQMLGQKFDQLYLLSDVLREESFTELFANAKVLTLLHVLSSLEWQLDWLKQDVCYFDEQISKKEFLGSTLLQGGRYEKRMQEWSKGLRDLCVSHQGQYLLLTDKTSLREYLDQLFS